MPFASLDDHRTYNSCVDLHTGYGYNHLTPYFGLANSPGGIDPRQARLSHPLIESEIIDTPHLEAPSTPRLVPAYLLAPDVARPIYPTPDACPSDTGVRSRVSSPFFNVQEAAPLPPACPTYLASTVASYPLLPSAGGASHTVDPTMLHQNWYSPPFAAFEAPAACERTQLPLVGSQVQAPSAMPQSSDLASHLMSAPSVKEYSQSIVEPGPNDNRKWATSTAHHASVARRRSSNHLGSRQQASGTARGRVVPENVGQHFQDGEERPWVCGINGCTKRYKRFEHVRRHRKGMHDGERVSVQKADGADSVAFPVRVLQQEVQSRRQSRKPYSR
ncbi:hypothetical protein P7C73_g2130, partial [Tremellales sp. Uapishka_1]